ncbi:hypothetical protein [Nocardia brasiliensis]|uniref:hypothetical protein n=1 Tax=Nocardia brasiliensis TaxID=37326 RepID=UPI001580BD15
MVAYDCGASLLSIERPDLPEYMTWGELQCLPEEIAEQVELGDGRVGWVRRGPGEHQTFARRLTNSLGHCSRKAMADSSERCRVVNFETDVFRGSSGKSDFLTPDFLVA